MTLKASSNPAEHDTELTADAEPVRTGVDCPEPGLGPSTYRFLTGQNQVDADISDDFSFDAHVLASIIALSVTEGGALTTRAGLAAADLDLLAARWFPHARTMLAAKAGTFVEDEEATLLRDLLRSYADKQSTLRAWLAPMIARRAVEPNHLWEDLGLRERSELTRLLHRHFAPLAERNTNGMRWKRFFYRMLCEDDGFLMCATPVCTECHDFNECFGEENGESRLAQRRRDEDLELTDQTMPPPSRPQQGTLD